LSHAPQNIDFAPEQMISSLAVASHNKSLTKLWIQLEPKNVNSIMERRDVLGRNTEFTNKKVCVVGSSGGGGGEVGLSGGGGGEIGPSSCWVSINYGNDANVSP
jgi:hypothetical protein